MHKYIFYADWRWPWLGRMKLERKDISSLVPVFGGIPSNYTQNTVYSTQHDIDTNSLDTHRDTTVMTKTEQSM